MALKPPWTPCKHEHFEAHCIVAPRISDKEKLCVNVRVRCDDCKREFRFDEMERGLLGGQRPATAGYIGYGAILPISPLDEPTQRIIDSTDPWEGEKS